MSKYHNIHITADGYRFDSVAEYRHYMDLCLRQQAGDISDLTVHPRYTIVDAFIYDNKRERAVEYEADFSYVENGREVVEDVKGAETDVFKIKRKLFLLRYPDLDFRIVRA